MRRLHTFWRARLSRRIFVWLALTVVVTGLAVVATGFLLFLSGDNPELNHLSRLEGFVGRQLARVWDEPEQRGELVDALAGDLDFNVRVVDADGMPIETRGVGECRPPIILVPVLRDGRTLGRATLCRTRPRPWPWRLLVILSVVLIVLWAASGVVARRLGRPLLTLSRAADRLGRGQLDTRVESLEAAGAEFEHLGVALNQMADRVEGEIQRERELLAEVSHELRTPLGHLRLLVELVRSPGGSPTRETLDRLEAEIVEMDDLVDHLLASSRLNMKLQTPVRLSGAEIALAAIERAGLDPSLLEVIDSDVVEGDPTLIARALANLIQNAERHGGGVVHLVVERRGALLAFCVEDDGPGLGGLGAEIFDPFVQHDAGGAGVLGLGLALVARVAKAHGGTVSAEPRAEGGARLVIALPVG